MQWKSYFWICSSDEFFSEQLSGNSAMSGNNKSKRQHYIIVYIKGSRQFSVIADQNR